MSIEPSTTTAPETPQTDAPVTPAVAGSWFPGPDDEATIPLPGGHSMVIKTELETGETTGMMAGLPTDTPEALNASFQTYRLRNLAAYLVSWTLPVAVPTKPEKRLALVSELGSVAFERIYTELAEWVTAHASTEIAIVPVKPLPDFDTWFVAGDAAWTLDLPGGEWFRVRAELTAGTKAKLVANGGGHEQGLRKVAAYLVDWSLTMPGGRRVVPHIDSLKAMKTSRFSILYRTVLDYEAALEARAANPIGGIGSANPSASVN